MLNRGVFNNDIMTDLSSIDSRIKEALSEVRPYLQEDGGDVEFVRFEDNTRVAEIRMTGSCIDCPLSIMTLRAGIERHLIKSVPEIRRVEAVR